MKKFLSIILEILLVFSVMTPITVFAENGPYPFDPESEDIKLNEISALGLTDAKTLDMAILYPEIPELPNPEIFSGASYDLETNTLTLNNVRCTTAVLSATEMGEDFKIKLIGYNELGGIYSEAEKRGASITFTGDGELVLNRNGGFSGIYIDANLTPSVLHFEKNVQFATYFHQGDEHGAVYVKDSSVTDKSKIIQVDGPCTNFSYIAYEESPMPIYKQMEAYDIDYCNLDYYDAGFKKDGVYYIGFEDYDETTFEPNGKYYLFALEFDELLDSYVATDYAVETPIIPDGFEKISEYEPIQDENSEAFIGYSDNYIEGETSYKYVFYPESKDAFDLCKDNNDTIYGFWQFRYVDEENGNIDIETYIYNLVEHPTYGYVAFPNKTKTSMNGLTPLVERYVDAMNAFIDPTFTVNGGSAMSKPSKIKNIKATSTTNGVKITWSANSVAEEYKIYRKAEGDKKWTTLDTIDADKTSFTDKTAKSGKKYTYTVKGYNFVGAGSSNSTGVTHTYYSAPKVSIKNTTKGIYLDWAKITGATKYRIYRQTSGSSKWTLIDTVKSTSFTDKTAKSGKKYYYRVRAAKGDIMSSYNEVSKYFLSAPKLSSAKNSASGVKVTWKKVTGAEGYKVYRKSGSGSYKYIGKTSKLYYTDKTAKSGTTYTYTVKAYKSKTESSYNSGLSRKYLAAPKVETKVYTTSINLSWKKIGGSKEYAVYRKARGESKYKKVATTTKTSYKDTNVKNNKTYYYQVKAINGKTISSYDTVKQLFLSVPKLSSVKNDRNGVEFKWEKVSGAETYKIYRKTGSGNFKLLGTTKKTTYIDDSAKSGTVYTYTVKACKDNATSYYNKTGLKIRFVDTSTFYTPDNVNNGIQLRWHDADKVDKYYIYREVDGTNTKKQIAVLDPDDLKRDEYGVLMYVDKTAKNGETYAYYMRVSYKGTYSGYTWSTGKYVTRMESVDVISATATSNGIKIKWEKSPYATGYRILRKEKGVDENYKYYSGTANGNTTTYTDKNVESGKTYTYAIMAFHDENNGKGGSSAIGGSKSAKAK